MSCEGFRGSAYNDALVAVRSATGIFFTWVIAVRRVFAARGSNRCPITFMGDAFAFVSELGAEPGLRAMAVWFLTGKQQRQRHGTLQSQRRA